MFCCSASLTAKDFDAFASCLDGWFLLFSLSSLQAQVTVNQGDPVRSKHDTAVGGPGTVLALGGEAASTNRPASPPPTSPNTQSEPTYIQVSEDTLASDLAKVFNTTAEIPSAPVTGITPLDQTVPSSSSQTDAGQTSATVKSLEEVMGEPNLRSTPVSSPNLKSRFDVQKVIEKRLSLGLNIGAADQHRRESLLSEGRVSPEAEHYDSSPSPGSCYDTASESVEPGVNIVEPMSQLSLENAVSQTLATSLYSWPSTWPESTSLTNTWQDSGTTRSREEHHASGDSIPVGCEASHLDTSHDSGLASFTQNSARAGSSHSAARQSASKELFYPGPEATFMPVEPPKDPPVSISSCPHHDHFKQKINMKI